ncbi:MAG TPA: hypothetical protein VGE25_15530 [Sediminibacterium sp.]
MKKTLFVIFILTFISQLLYSQSTSPIDSAKINLNRMRFVCACVSNRVPDGTKKYKWLYRKTIYEVSGVKDTDSEAEVIQKIQRTWRIYESQMLCSGAQFDVTKGNIVKWGVSYQFDDFINDIIKWGINLNKVDESDGRTALDYTLFHVERNKGNAMEEVYQDLYDRLRKAGAKHRKELPDQ